LTSRGRSITTDFPTPSATKREPESLAATWITCWRMSLAGERPVTVSPNARIIDTSKVARISGASAI
jgi:hypothetical protein